MSTFQVEFAVLWIMGIALMAMIIILYRASREISRKVTLFVPKPFPFRVVQFQDCLLLFYPHEIYISEDGGFTWSRFSAPPCRY